MSKAPSMPMFWDAYLADTTHLTTEEHGAYLLLLAAMWRRNGYVPDNDRDNARILGLTVAKWRRIKERLAGFLEIENGQISQKNLRKIWKNTQEKIEKNKENGARGGRPKSKKNNDISKANGSVSQNPNKTIPEPEPEPDIRREDTDVSLSVSPSSDVSEAVIFFNEIAEKCGWSQVQKMTPQRLRSLRARLSECGGIDGWRMAVDRAAQSNFLCGRTSKPWNGFGFDWLVKSQNFTKLMEGNYDNRDRHANSGFADRPQDWPDPALEQIARLARLGASSGDGRS